LITSFENFDFFDGFVGVIEHVFTEAAVPPMLSLIGVPKLALLA
jgi:hypothetical protein